MKKILKHAIKNHLSEIKEEEHEWKTFFSLIKEFEKTLI